MNRSKQQLLFVMTVVVTGLVTGLGAFALWGPDTQTPIRVGGALMIGSGLLLLLLNRNPFTVAPDSTLEQIALQRLARRRIHVISATSVLMGLGNLVPDSRLGMVLIACGAVTSLSAAFKRPRRWWVTT